jgi:uncharacterized protein (DUF488 family)
MAYPFYTIGHATRPTGQFIALLQSAEVTLVADVRTVPRSRTNPQYDRNVLPQALAASHIGYEHIAALGGLRGRQRDVPPEVNAFWQNESFHNYADYAIGDSFRAGLTRLRELATDNAAPSCARKRYGGDAIDGSSPTTCWRQAIPCSTSCDPGTSNRRV